MDDYRLAAQWIDAADGLLITAGAGMGIDSGLPDFRGDNGFWNAYPGLGKQGLDFIDIADPRKFVTDPSLAWGFYGHRLNLYRNTQPHEGFNTLNRWSQSKKYGAFVFTSNVDGHFEKAGFDADRVYECHGSIHRLQCCGECSDTWSAEPLAPEIDSVTGLLISEPPICQHCSRMARPNILMFGDFNWQSQPSSIQHARYQKWLRRVDNIVVIELGAGTAIPSARAEGERQAGGKLIRINPQEPEVSRGRGVSIRAGALEALGLIDSLLAN